jgi:hypothetical protein
MVPYYNRLSKSCPSSVGGCSGHQSDHQGSTFHDCFSLASATSVTLSRRCSSRTSAKPTVDPILGAAIVERSVDVPRRRGVLAAVPSVVDMGEIDGLIDMYGGNDVEEEM